MAWDNAAQHGFVIPGGGRGEAGYADFSSGSRNVEVPTKLRKCYYGSGMADTDTDTGNFTIAVTTDCSISSDCITFKRHATFITEDVRFRYIVLGW